MEPRNSDRSLGAIILGAGDYEPEDDRSIGSRLLGGGDDPAPWEDDDRSLGSRFFSHED